MTFLEIIPHLKQAKKATRPGLGGYLAIANGIMQSIPITNELEIQPEAHFVVICDDFEMIEAFVPWLEDLEAEDWIVNE